ncbi:hypothetical protein Bbelb_070990 [Branchiostoma belcheri]|nr:hypothetical protein Bbelb_070990 [Branchiostoma belcheri]
MPDFILLQHDAQLKQRFDNRVSANIASQTFNPNDPAESLENLQKSVSEAASAVLPKRTSRPLRKRVVSTRTKNLYAHRQNNFQNMNSQQRKEVSKAIAQSTRKDYRSCIDSIISDMEVAEQTGNSQEITRLTKILSGKTNSTVTMPSKDLAGEPIVSSEQLLSAWNVFLAQKFATPPADSHRQRETTVIQEDHLSDSELEECLKALKSGQAPGYDKIPIEAYQHSPAAKRELFRAVHLIWESEIIPAELVKGIFIMLYKKKDRNNYSNYRAICLLSHAYKLLSSVIARRLHIQLEPLIPDSDNVCILKWTINMLLRESNPAVVTFIDYAAAFDNESQLFLDEALSSAGASPKLRRIIQAIINAVTGCVRVTSSNGNQEFSEPFEISRGVLQGDIIKHYIRLRQNVPVDSLSADALLCQFELDASGTKCWASGVRKTLEECGFGYVWNSPTSPPYQVTISRLEYADDAGLLDGSVREASQRISRIASGSKDDAAIEISVPKTKAMHIHRKERVSKTTEAEVAALNPKHRCPECTRKFPTKRGLAIHRSRWCLHHPSTANTRSRTGTLADKEVQRQKRLAKEKERPHVTLQGQQLQNVHALDYLGSRMQCGGDQEADVNHRMVIAQTRFSSLQHIWKDHSLPHSLKVRLYKSSVCSTLTHSCEAWDLTQDVTRMINGFNSRCLQVITKKHFRGTATNPDYNLMLTIRHRRLRYLGHILRMDPSRLVRRTLKAYVCGGDNPPEGSLLMDYMAENLPPPDDDAIEQGYDSDQTFCEEVEWDGVDMETLQNEAKLLRTSTPVQGATEADMFEDTYDPSADLFARSHDDSSMEGVTSTERSTIECPVADADMAEESAEESNQKTAMDLRTVIPETQEVHGQVAQPAPPPKKHAAGNTTGKAVGPMHSHTRNSGYGPEDACRARGLSCRRALGHPWRGKPYVTTAPPQSIRCREKIGTGASPVCSWRAN